MLRSLFGALRLSSPRFKTCPCRRGGPATVSPLAEILPERTTPELAYWEAKYAALASYGVAAALLTDTFPLGRTLQAGALRRRTTRTAQRLEAELGDEQASFIDAGAATPHLAGRACGRWGRAAQQRHRRTHRPARPRPRVCRWRWV